MMNVEAISNKQRFLAMSELLPNYKTIADMQKKVMFILNA